MLVSPIASYRSECWALKASDRKKTNEEVLEKTNCEGTLINILDAKKLAFIGHQLRKNVRKKLLFGSVYDGQRLRGRPNTRLSDDIKEIYGLTMVETERKAQERTQ